MHNIMDDVKSYKTFDLDREYDNSLKNNNFKKLTDNLKLSKDVLKKYTSIIEECASEFENCKNCKNIMECKNKKEGYCYLPRNIEGRVEFIYKPCKYKEAIDKKYKYQENIKYFNTPEYVKDASFDNIYKKDKARFEVINWLMDFYDYYKAGEKKKGLYLNGNFGCGKTYLIAAMFNELAKDGAKSCIIFWPEFLRQVFYDDFNSKFEYVKKVPLLLIDDIGAEGLTAYNRDEVLCPLLQYRMDNSLSTFFTSNLDLKDLETHLSITKGGVDGVKARRIISRIEQLTENKSLISKNLRK